ncbi:unnamed protein product [Chrysodeixis includens]|uniref:Uncharacterized protein n=1 Tax=Chrysodeixis includens TaxID=689277 RepID=A0A9P0BSB1_CHRIL|nr:unnamed protein product [Chrysodeixis includens]
MIQIKYIIFVSFLSAAFCSKCLRYTFEEDYESLFEKCTIQALQEILWSHGHYNTTEVTGQHAYSSAFISPSGSATLSCVSSFSFSMAPNGLIEIIAYMDSVSPSDLIAVLAYEITGESGIDTSVGSVLLSPVITNFKQGWNHLKISVISRTDFEGYLTFMGTAAEGSTVLIDSFRYIPPDQDESSCEIYTTTNHD